VNGALAPFKPARLDLRPRELIRNLCAKGLTRAQAKAAIRRLQSEEVFLNDEYQVNVDRSAPHGFADMAVVHLSVKRLDRGPLQDWRDLQAIKNMLVGEAFDAIQLYPAEERVVDTCNQFHLWVLVPANPCDPPPRLPLGWSVRLVTGESSLGAVQRPFPA
jgi:hypothetical protein